MPGMIFTFDILEALAAIAIVIACLAVWGWFLWR